MNNAAHIPFLFDQEFAIENSLNPSSEIEKNAKKPIEPSQTADTQATWQEGYDSGLEVGYERAMSSLQHSTSESLSQIYHQLVEAADSEKNARDISIEQVCKLAKAIAKPLVGRLLSETPSEPIIELASYCLENLYGESKVTIRVPIELNDAVSDALNSIGENLQRSTKVEVCGDMTLTGTNCKVEWGSGNAARDESEVWEMVDQTIQNRIGCHTQSTDNADLENSKSVQTNSEYGTPHRGGENNVPSQKEINGTIPPDSDAAASNDTNILIPVSPDETNASLTQTDQSSQTNDRVTVPPTEDDETLALALGPEIRKANRVAAEQEDKSG